MARLSYKQNKELEDVLQSLENAKTTANCLYWVGIATADLQNFLVRSAPLKKSDA